MNVTNYSVGNRNIQVTRGKEIYFLGIKKINVLRTFPLNLNVKVVYYTIFLIQSSGIRSILDVTQLP